MKILVLGATHGNESLGINLVRKLEKEPLEGVSGLLANLEAIKVNKRFVKNDLNRNFPGNLSSDDYEIRRAAEIVEECKEYDLVLDFHNTMTSLNDCAFIGTTKNYMLYDVAALFGLNRVIVVDDHYNCINKHAPNCISIELSMDSERNDHEYWYEMIHKLIEIDEIPKGKTENYRFTGTISLEDRDRLDLENKKLIPFEKMDDEIAKKLGVETPAYPLFVGLGFTPDNYGSTLKKIS